MAIPTRIHQHFLLAAGAILVASCDALDRPTVPHPLTALSTQVAAAPESYWSSVPDSQLMARAAKDNYVLLIGFKEPGAARGVGPDGRVLVSDVAVSAEVSEIRARGGTGSSASSM
jgi:hypothetical protein